MKWLKRSRRRTAIIKVMTKPKIPSEIHEQALKDIISLSNTGEVLRALVKEGVVVCLNPEEKIGKLYALTKKGRATRNKMYPGEPSYQDIPIEILKEYAYIMRGKHRRAVIKVMDNRKTPSQIHRDVIGSSENIHPGSIYYVKLSLNSTSDTLMGFRKKNIAICLNKEKRIGRLYELTKKGRVIREQILKE